MRPISLAAPKTLFPISFGSFVTKSDLFIYKKSFEGFLLLTVESMVLLHCKVLVILVGVLSQFVVEGMLQYLFHIILVLFLRQNAAGNKC